MIVLKASIVVTKPYKGSSKSLFNGLPEGSVVTFELPLDVQDRGGNGLYATYVKVTSGDLTEEINQTRLAKILSKLEYV